MRVATPQSAWRLGMGVSTTFHVAIILLAAAIVFSVRATKPQEARFEADIAAADFAEPAVTIEPRALSPVMLDTREVNPNAGGDGELAMLNPDSLRSGRLNVSSPGVRAELSPTRAGEGDLGGLGEIVADADGQSRSPRTKSAGHGSGSGVGDGAEPGFFGIKTEGRRIVYVVDGSSSMNRPVEGPAKTRFQQLKLELVRSIAALDEGQQFYMIFFNEHPLPMPSSGFEPATPANQDRLLRWMASVKADGLTDPREAMIAALALNPDEIYLLTDGTFSVSVEHDLKRMRRASVTIHTIAFGDRSAEPFLKSLAATNRGHFSFVP